MCEGEKLAATAVTIRVPFTVDTMMQQSTLTVKYTNDARIVTDPPTATFDKVSRCEKQQQRWALPSVHMRVKHGDKVFFFLNLLLEPESQWR